MDKLLYSLSAFSPQRGIAFSPHLAYGVVKAGRDRP